MNDFNDSGKGGVTVALILGAFATIGVIASYPVVVAIFRLAL